MDLSVAAGAAGGWRRHRRSVGGSSTTPSSFHHHFTPESSGVGGHWQRCTAGTPASTCSTCRPHPVYVAFLQVEQTAR